MKLYYAPGTCALACWIALEWAGIEYEVEAADLRSDQYRKINPLSMVPAIDLGGERCLTQTGAILRHIADLPIGECLGADPGAAAEAEFDEIMFFLTGDFHPAFWPFFSPRRFTQMEGKDSLASVRAAALPRIDRVLDHLDRLIGHTTHVYRGRRTVADAYAFVMTRWSENIPKTWRAYGNVARFMDQMMRDDAVRKVLTLSSTQ